MCIKRPAVGAQPLDDVGPCLRDDPDRPAEADQHDSARNGDDDDD
jgi:hypothetical protein